MEPESGSEGSSTVEPVQVTRICTTTALLGAMLMHSIKRLASEADKAGRRPVIMLHYDLAASFWHREELPMPLLVACQATKSRPRASVAQHGQWGRRPRTAPRWRSTWPRWPASGRTRQSTIGFFGRKRAERGFGLPSRDSSAARRYAGRERLFDRRERGVLGGFRLCLALAFISFVNVVAAPRYPGGHSVAGYRGAIKNSVRSGETRNAAQPQLQRGSCKFGQVLQ